MPSNCHFQLFVVPRDVLRGFGAEIGHPFIRVCHMPPNLPSRLRQCVCCLFWSEADLGVATERASSKEKGAFAEKSIYWNRDCLVGPTYMGLPHRRSQSPTSVERRSCHRITYARGTSNPLGTRRNRAIPY